MIVLKTILIKLSILIGLSNLYASDRDIPQIFINEFLASNSNSSYDSDFISFCDWIELFNSEDSIVNISGYYITDDLSNPYQFTFPEDTYIQPNSFLIIWADGKNYSPGNYHIYPEDIDISVNDFHSNFKLKKSGEEIGLFTNDGVLIDSISYQNQLTDISYGRSPDGANEWKYFFDITPNLQNSVIGYNSSSRLDEPQVNILAGVYEGSQIISYDNDNSISIIRYTLDGSIPNYNSPLYLGPIFIDSTSVIRARAFSSRGNNNFLPSVISSNSYFIDSNHDLPIISLTTDSSFLFDDYIGIYVVGNNGTIYHGDWGSRANMGVANYFQDWERPASLEYFDEDGNLGFKSRAGIKIHGGWSRLTDQKSLTVHFRNSYGSDEINYQIFKDKEIQSFDTFLLRNGGSDWFESMIRDGLTHSLVDGKIDIDRLSYEPCVVYINGKYWGIHNIRERSNSSFIQNNYGIDEDEIDILGMKYYYSYAIEGNFEDYNELISFMENNDLASQESFEELGALIDFNELLNFYITQIYIGNCDWPGNNLKLWKRKSSNGGGLWRWIMMDTDAGFGYGCCNPYYSSPICNYDFNHVDYTFNPNNETWAHRPFNLLLNNNAFKNEFLQRFSTHLNTVFEKDNVLRVIDSLKIDVETEMPRHLQRWNTNTLPGWYDIIEIMKNYATERSTYLRQHIMDYFEIDGQSQLILENNNPLGGTVKIHDMEISSFPDTNIFFNNIPVRLSAIPSPGFYFSGWHSDLGFFDSTSIFLLQDNDFTIEAGFSAISPLELIYPATIDSFDTDSDDIDELTFHWFQGQDSILHLMYKLNIQSNFFDYSISFDNLTETSKSIDIDTLNIFFGQYEISSDNISWYVEAYNSDISIFSDTLNFFIYKSSLKSINEGETIPNVYYLNQNFPNPFNNMTTIEYSLGNEKSANLMIYNINGQKIKGFRLRNSNVNGVSFINWNMKDDNSNEVVSGIYFYILESENFIIKKKMIVIK